MTEVCVAKETKSIEATVLGNVFRLWIEDYGRRVITETVLPQSQILQ